MAVRDEQLRMHPRCEWCGALATEVDHRRRLADGGSDHPSNLQSLCHDCHADKSASER